jgi:hypothetical protein
VATTSTISLPLPEQKSMAYAGDARVSANS